MLRPHLTKEYEWLEKMIVTEEVDDDLSITWSAHHAAEQRSKEFEVSITSLLPLLRDQAHSVATIKHVMDKVRDTVALLNPGQTPVIAADQPLYALAKQIQWHWPENYGEDKFVFMFGGLHIEMDAFKSIGRLEVFLKAVDGQVHSPRQRWPHLVLQSLSCQLRVSQEHVKHTK